ncbi:Penicillin G acylase [Halioglobus japonicus]|nr:Penicillin G acylase [Halioglobus japonicus]
MSKFTASHRTSGARLLLVPGLAIAVSMAGCSNGNNSNNSDDSQQPPVDPPALVDRAHYVLPPGNFGGLPTSVNSLDQLPLYDGLTPLRGDVTDADIESLFIPEDFQPVGETTVEATGRPGTTIVYDEFGVAHITGDTRDDLSFGAGWVTARDRNLLVSLGRGPARVAVADVPGINAFGLVTSAQEFIPSAATEQLVTDQVDLIIEEFGDLGREVVADAEAYVAGYNAYLDSQGDNPDPVTVNDVIATTAFIGSIFGAGGGAEAQNAEFLSTLQAGLGDGPGQLAWEDAMLFNDPEAPTTISTRFEYGPMTGGPVTGSAVIDAGSIISLDPRAPEVPLAFDTSVPLAKDPNPLQLVEYFAETTAQAFGAGDSVLIRAADAPYKRRASNFLIVDAPQSANDTNLAVMGPQLGYYYPEIVMQIHLSGPGIEAQGAAVPGLSMYLLLGRTQDYAWSLTSASQDVRDVFVEELCSTDDSAPTRDSDHYMYNGECIAFEMFEAGTLNGVPLRYPVSVHGPMIGTATSNGTPVALTRKRSTFGRDGLNLAALKLMTEGEATTPQKFWESANNFGFTFNWGYMSRDSNAYFASGYLPVRAPGLDRRLPTWGTGEYEWEGFLSQAEHPHAVGGPSGRLLNWNNQSAPGFMHGDDEPYGSVHRVQLFDQFPDKVELAGVVGIMNRSATEDTLSPVWPVLSEVLRGSEPPTELAGQVVDIIDAWVADDAPRLDADNDGFYDDAGPAIMDELFRPLAVAVMEPVFGASVSALNSRVNLGGSNGASLVDKDLRTLLGKPVEGPFSLSYCGEGDLEVCRESLWAVVEEVALELADEYGSDDPTTWLREGALTRFSPGLIPNTFRATNRPTFQQVLEFIPTAGG